MMHDDKHSGDCSPFMLRMIKNDTHSFCKLPDPWGELLVQRSVEDLQSRQDAGNFTVSRKSQNMIKSALHEVLKQVQWIQLSSTGPVTVLLRYFGFLSTGNVTKSSTGRPGCQILKIPIGFSIFEICKRRFDPWSPPPRSTQESRDPPCPLLNGSEPSPIQGGASMNETSSGMLHRYLVRLGSGEFGGQFQTLSFLSRSSGHSRAVTILSSGSTCSGSAVEFKRVVRVEWHPHERQDPRYPIRTMNCR